MGKRESGSTLVESLIAFVIVSFSALAMYPIFFSAKKTSKYTDAKHSCERLVKSKLDEYRFGRLVDLSTAAPPLNNLSISTLTDTNFSGLNPAGGGGSGPNPTPAPLVSGGFLYAKYRYNQFFPTSCSGISQAGVINDPNFAHASPIGSRQYGMRECISGNALGVVNAWDDVGVGPGCPSTDQRIALELPNFKMYVKLELATPWQLQIPGGTAGEKSAQFSNTCPSFSGWAPGNTGAYGAGTVYDFDGADDGIRVTVTGVMDTVDGVADVTDPNRLVCSATATLYPHRFAARFYSTVSGRIYPISGGGLHGSQDQSAAGGWSFRSLVTQNAGTGVTGGGILSFAVHPRNLSIYVLKRGSITRYSDCGGLPLDCSLVASNTGISDLGGGAGSGWPSVQEFAVPSSIQAIGVDFRTGAVYGMLSHGQDFLRIDCNDGSPLRDSNLATGCNDHGGVRTQSVADGVFPKLTGTTGTGISSASAMHLKGFFLSPMGTEAYVVDHQHTNIVAPTPGDTPAAFNLFGNRTHYQTVVFRQTEIGRGAPVIILPLQAVSLSM